MKIRILILFAATMFSFACNSEKSQFKQQITELETEVETQATAQSVTNLFKKYDEYTSTFPDDTENNGRYMYRAAGMAYRAGNYAKTAEYLERGIKDFSGSSITPSSRLLLGTVYEENLNNIDKAKTNFQHVLDNHPNHKGAERAALFFKPADEKLQILIAQKEAAAKDENGTLKPRIAADLYQKYTAYAEQFPDDKTRTPDYLLKGGELLSFMNNPAAAAKSFEQVLVKYPKSKAAPQATLLLAGLYDDQLNKGIEAQELGQAFVNTFPNHPDVEKAKYYLKPEKERLDMRIIELEAQLYPESAAKIDPIAAGKLNRKYETYAKRFPKDEKAADYLYKAGEVARSTGDMRRSVSLLEQLYDDYRNYEKAPQALFLAGFIYENDLKNLDKAKEIYNTFMKKYPKHELAKSVEFSLQNLGKPADEIIKGFETK